MTQHEIIRSAGDFDQSLLSSKLHERGCDVEIIFNEQRIPLHSVVLGGNSRYFEVNFFSTPIVPKAIHLENANTEAVKAIIEYCYEGKIKLQQNDTINVLENALFLMVQPVIDGCCKILISTLDSENCFEIWKLGQKLPLISLEKGTFDYIRTTFNGIPEDFLSINLIQLIKNFQSKIFGCAVKKHLRLIKEWINYDPEARKENLVNLLKQIQLENLPPKALATEAKNMCLDKSCSDLFFDAIYTSKNTDVSEFYNDESTLIVLGGDNSDQCKIVETYDNGSSNWKQREVQFGKNNFSCVFYNQKIFVLGGSASNTVECYDMKTWRKTSLASMHQSRYYFTAVVVGDDIYAIGGYSSSSQLSSVERYGVKANQWTRLNSMPTARRLHKAAVVDGEIFVVGGESENGHSAINECYTISTGNWRSCKPMQEKRRQVAVAALHGFVYAAGGFNGSNLSSVERYDPKVDQWTFIKPISSPRHAAILVKNCGSLVISGGYSNGAINNVEMYDPLTNRWSILAPLNKARYHHDMIMVPKYLLD